MKKHPLLWFQRAGVLYTHTYWHTLDKSSERCSVIALKTQTTVKHLCQLSVKENVKIIYQLLEVNVNLQKISSLIFSESNSNIRSHFMHSIRPCK